MISSVNITRNGTITADPDYPYYKTPYSGGDHSVIRDWMNDEELILEPNVGEDRKDFAWRQIKHINEWCSLHLPWPDTGVNTDSGSFASGLAIDYLTTYGKKATILGGAFTATAGSLSSVGLLVSRGKDTPAWSKLSSGVSGGSARVNCMVEFNGELIVGGSFNSCTHPKRGTVTLGNIARWTGDHFEPFQVGGSTDFNNEVFALYVWNNQLYVGGAFTTAAGTTVNRIARWSGTAWEALPPGGASSNAVGFNNSVLSLYEYGGKLLIGGRMTNVRGTNTHSHLTAYDGGATASAFTWLDGTTGNGSDNFPTTNGNVWCMLNQSGSLVVAGSFATIAGVTYNHIAKWSGSAWSALGTGVDSPALDSGSTASTSAIRCLAIFGGDLIAGGHFGSMSGVGSTQYIAKWNGSAWSAMGAGITTTGNFVRSLYVLGSDLVVGSTLANGATDAGDYIQKWTGSAWASFATGFNGVVAAIGEYRYNWSCGAISIVAASCLMALGIPVRGIGGTDPLTASDGAYEVYDARNDKWVMMLPHMNFWVEDANGVPQSAGDVRAAVEAGSIAITYSNWAFTFTASNGFVGRPDNTIRQEIPPLGSMAAWCGVPVSYPFYGGSGDGYLLYHVYVRWYYDLNNSPPSASTVYNYDPGGGLPFVTDLRDTNLSHPLNQLVASVAIVGSAVHITLTDSMYDAPVTIEMSEDGGATWAEIDLTEVSPDVYAWTPPGNATLMLRAVNAAGQQSNNVVIQAIGGAKSNSPFRTRRRGT